jgi:hypothetical protein
MATSIIDEIVPKFRRAIADTEEPYAYTDNALSEYIEDSVDQLYLEWKHDYVVDRDNHEIEPDVIPAHQMLIVMYSKLEMMKNKPDISFKSNSLSVTRKSDNKKILQNKIDDVINSIVTLDCIGLTNTELDEYANRWENWLYIETL